MLRTSTTAYLILARHGQSTWNLENRVQGQLDVPLTDKGQAEGTTLGHALEQRRHRIKKAYHSGLVRAKDTLSNALAVAAPGAEVVETAELKERHWGIYQGQTGSDIDPVREELMAYDTVPEGGESFAQVMDRVVRFHSEVLIPELDRLEDGEAVAVFAHSGPLAMLQCYLEDMEWGDPGVGTPNAGARIYKFQNGVLTLVDVYDPSAT